jgi:predicted metal-binding protein
MLSASSSATGLVVCSTCRVSKDARTDQAGRHGGALFAEAVASALPGHPCRNQIQLETMPCLFACSSHCTAYLRSAGRMGYILGRFTPSPPDATALLDYVARYLDTPDGVVAYKHWPEGIKGHFLVRVPPDGFVWGPAPESSDVRTTG